MTPPASDSNPADPGTIAAVADLIAGSEGVLFITGAGISVASGLPTYRGIGGLYEGKETEDGMPIEVALSGQMLRERPDVAWKYLWQIADAVRGAKPNRGHEVIVEMERRKPESWVLTQNVDGLHRAAGSRNLIEIHGRAYSLFCVDCDFRCDGEPFLYGNGATKSISVHKPDPPSCPRCGGLVRPDVVLFGEQLPAAEVTKLESLLGRELQAVISVGTSSLFPYITAPVQIAREFGVPTVEINSGRTEISDIYDYRIEMDAAEALESLWAAYRERLE